MRYGSVFWPEGLIQKGPPGTWMIAVWSRVTEDRSTIRVSITIHSHPGTTVSIGLLRPPDP